MALATNAASPLDIDDLSGGLQNVHPSVVDTHEITGGLDWNGYRYWMAYTPYPNSDDDEENPCIAVSNDRLTWVTPPGVTNPLVSEPDKAQPGNRFHSDTDLMLEPDGSIMHMIYREAGTVNPYKMVEVFLISTSDGVNWSTPVEIYNSGVALDSSNGTMLSPTLTNYNGTYLSHYVLNSTNMPEGGTVEAIGLRTAPAVTGPWSSETRVPIPDIGGGQAPWHMAVRLEPNGVLRFVLQYRSSPTSIWLGDSSGPGITPSNMVKVLGEAPGEWDDEVYRACIIPLDSGLGYYGLYYSAFNSNIWGIGYTAFAYQAPVYTGEETTELATVEGVIPTKLFEFRVRARDNDAEESAWSSWLPVPASGGSVTTPVSLSLSNLTGTSVRLSWGRA